MLLSFRKVFLLTITLLVTAYSQQTDDSYKLYDDTQVARVDITIAPEKLTWIFQNVSSDSEHVASFSFKNKYLNETFDSIGFRLRGNTSRDAKKKSFSVSFNTFKKGGSFYSIDKINLNGEHNDPSLVRSKLSFDMFQRAGIISSRVGYAEVYINNKYYGLYINVEHIDDEFLWKNYVDDSGNLWKCLYPADLTYRGSDPAIYRDMKSGDNFVYELKSNEAQSDYSQLVRLITILNSTSTASLPDSLEKIFDMRTLLQYYAMNTLIGSWDDYRSLRNNYYLYLNPTNQKFEIIPYDYDNTFGVDWFNKDWATANPYSYPKANSGSRPLWDKIIVNNQYRDLYTHFIEFYRDNVYALNIWDKRLDSLRNLLATPAFADTFRTLDYDFNTTDFIVSYSNSYSNQHVKKGIRQFMNDRVSSLGSQLNYKNAAPMLYYYSISDATPGANDSLFISASAFGRPGLKEVKLWLNKNDGSAAIGYVMKFSPIPGTTLVEESDRYTVTLPPLGANVNANISFSVTDNTQQSTLYPRGSTIKITSGGASFTDVVINEFLADNAVTTPDGAGDHDDWLELYNPTNKPVLLTGRYLTDSPDNLKKWRFTKDSLFLNPGSYMLIWCDEDSDPTEIHTNFKLSKGGEFLALTDSTGTTVIDSLSFGQQTTDISYGRKPDGGNTWVFMNPPTPGNSNTGTSIQNIELPLTFSLTAYPNPFNPETTIQYTLNENSNVEILMYSVVGELMFEVNQGLQNKGLHNYRWNASALPSGVYFITVKTETNISTIKTMLLK